MPYIKKEHRDGAQILPFNAGELNFAFTKLIIKYINEKGLKYQTFNDILGAIEGAKIELYNRVITPYELSKQIENGDVYDEIQELWDKL